MTRMSPGEYSELAGVVMSHIASNLQPDDVFEEPVLDAWARENGYTKEPTK